MGESEGPPGQLGRRAVTGTPTTGDAAAAVQIISEIVGSQSKREDNLNTRGAAVAGAAGLVITLAGGVAKTIFRELEAVG